jgi:hypothetical protein
MDSFKAIPVIQFVPYQESNQLQTPKQNQYPTGQINNQPLFNQQIQHPSTLEDGNITTLNDIVSPLPSSTLGGSQIAPSMLNDPNFIPGFLRQNIGKLVRVEFLIGTSSTTDRLGTLVGVGSNYILLTLTESDDTLMADLYSIKFVTIYE